MSATTTAVADLLARGDVCSVEEMAACLCVSRGSAYAAVRRGELPALKIGARYVVPVRRLAALVGVDAQEVS
ncbi:MAG: helix-turn-helix domain-containing protein [Acidimicrobiales bacterium]